MVTLYQDKTLLMYRLVITLNLCTYFDNVV